MKVDKIFWLAVVLALVAVFAVLTIQSEAATITVPDDYLTIQEAVNSADDYDTIYVKAGVYTENISIDLPCTLEGASCENTTIYWGSSATQLNVINITSDNVLIKGFNITESDSSGAGIYAEDVDTLTVENCIFYHNGDGMALNLIENLTVSNCIFNDSYAGVDSANIILYGKNILIEHSLFTTALYGIDCWDAFSYIMKWSYNITIQYNLFQDLGYGIEFLTTNNTKILYNNFTRIEWNAVDIIGNSIDEISRNHLIQGNIFENCTYPDAPFVIPQVKSVVYLSYVSNLTVYENYFYNSSGDPLSPIENYAISLNECDNITIYYNNFVGNDGFIYVYCPLLMLYPPQISLDNGTIGNYWDNYTGSDSNDDGIGDTPFPIFVFNNGVDPPVTYYDNYPLMNPMRIRYPVAPSEPEPEPESGMFDEVVDITIAAMLFIIMFLVIRVIILTIMHQGKKAMK